MHVCPHMLKQVFLRMTEPFRWLNSGSMVPDLQLSPRCRWVSGSRFFVLKTQKWVSEQGWIWKKLSQRESKFKKQKLTVPQTSLYRKAEQRAPVQGAFTQERTQTQAARWKVQEAKVKSPLQQRGPGKWVAREFLVPGVSKALWLGERSWFWKWLDWDMGKWSSDPIIHVSPLQPGNRYHSSWLHLLSMTGQRGSARTCKLCKGEAKQNQGQKSRAASWEPAKACWDWLCYFSQSPVLPPSSYLARLAVSNPAASPPDLSQCFDFAVWTLIFTLTKARKNDKTARFQGPFPNYLTSVFLLFSIIVIPQV